MPSDDWFEEAAREVSKNPANKARAHSEVERLKIAVAHKKKADEDAALRAATPGAARAAAGLFAAVSSGKVPPVGAGVPPRSFTTGGVVSGGGGSVHRPLLGVDFVDGRPRNSRAVSTKQAVEVLVEAVRKAYLANSLPNPGTGEEILEHSYEAALKRAGELITAVTNGIREELKELDPEA